MTTCSEQEDIDFTRFASGLRKWEVVVGFDIAAANQHYLREAEFVRKNAILWLNY